MALASQDFSDDAIILTNDEATLSKKHAVSLGYWNDPYITLLCRQSSKKTPEISRGYFGRIYAVKSLVGNFIKVTFLCFSLVHEMVILKFILGDEYVLHNVASRRVGINSEERSAGCNNISPT